LQQAIYSDAEQGDEQEKGYSGETVIASGKGP
jgi:hypothetical protein